MGDNTSPSSDSFGLDLLDFLFTFTLGFGLTPEVLNAGLSGLLSEEWRRQGRLPTLDEAFNVAVFVLGFLNLTLSWFGYHASIMRRPITYTSLYGMWRFIIDVTLVIVYGVILLEYKNFGMVLGYLIFVYWLFPIWDLLKVREYWDRDFKRKSGSFLTRYRRECVSAVCGLLFLVAGLMLHFELNRWCILSLAVFITVFYRVNKVFPTWERIFGVTDA